MIISTLKSIFKRLFNNKLYSTITIVGFSISLTFIILFSVYVKNEFSVNSAQINKNRIFRLRTEHISTFAPAIGAWVKEEIPEVESFCRIKSMTGIFNTTNSPKIEFKYLLADSSFFKMFNFKFIEGNKSSVLQTKNSVVLSKEFAQKVFGNKSPIGKKIMVNMSIPCVVSGVVDDISKTSIFSKCDVIVNFKLLADIWHWDNMESDFGNCSFGLYFLEKKNSNLPSKSPEILKIFKKDFWIFQKGRNKQLYFETLDQAYFSEIPGPGIRHNNLMLVKVLAIIVVLILLLSIINYLNLTIAQTGLRAKEIAIKKMLGNTRRKLIVQHVTETILICFIAFAIAILLSFLAEPVFNSLLKTKLYLTNQFENYNLLIFSAFIILIGFVSGIIPALLITKLNAIDVIKGGFRKKSKRVYSKILITFQYAVVIALLISTFTIVKQTNFLKKYNLGFNTKNIISLDYSFDLDKKELIKNELLKIPGVSNVSFAAGTPIDGGNNMSFLYNNKPVSFQEFLVDSAFFDMLDIKVANTGVTYSSDGMYLNRTAVNELDLDSLPKYFIAKNSKVPVLGIIDDFNFKSLHEKIGLLRIKQLKKDDYPWSILVQINSSGISQTLQKIRTVYSKVSNGIPAHISFFDDEILSWYDSENRISKTVTYFAILTIIISIMGTFAMSMFYSQQKTKEIGIRKVNGAGTFEMIKLLNKDFLLLVLIAFVIASPVAYYAMNRWLSSFAYKISLSWEVFALSGFIALLVAFLTVSQQTFSTARMNPVKTLRHE